MAARPDQGEASGHRVPTLQKVFGWGKGTFVRTPEHGSLEGEREAARPVRGGAMPQLR